MLDDLNRDLSCDDDICVRMFDVDVDIDVNIIASFSDVFFTLSSSLNFLLLFADAINVDVSMFMFIDIFSCKEADETIVLRDVVISRLLLVASFLISNLVDVIDF